MLPVSKKPPQIPGDADAAWWKAHQGDFTPWFEAVCDGEKVYYYNVEGNPFGPDAKGPPAVKLTMTQAINPSDDPFMPWPDMFPEHLSHPAVFQPTHDREFLLDPKPADGPPGTLRLRVRDTRFPDPGHPDLYKLWIDPAASYVAVRSETSVFRVGQPTEDRLCRYEGAGRPGAVAERFVVPDPGPAKDLGFEHRAGVEIPSRLRGPDPGRDFPAGEVKLFNGPPQS